MLGRPCVKLIEQECIVCGQADSLDEYYRHVPREGNYAYDLVIAVGLARFRDNRQDAEIQSDLQRRWNLPLPASSIGLLAHAFLDGLAAVHRAHTPALCRRLADDGGYAMHVDGTCEPGTDVIFTVMAEPRGWTLEVGKIATENKADISKLMRSAADLFGAPLAVMRDLSTNIEEGKRDAIPKARDLICHYHFLENVGEQLCEKPHAALTAELRRSKVRPALTSIRRDMVRWSRKGKRLSKEQIEHLLKYPDDIADLEPLLLRRFVAYVLLRWLDDFSSDLQGEYFPFDLPSLAFYRRALTLANTLADVVNKPDFRQRDLPTLRTISRHLAPLRENKAIIAAAARLEKANTLFKQVRKVLQLTSHPRDRLLRGRDPLESREVIETTQKRLETWREKLQNRHDKEVDAHKRADQATVLRYLRKYQEQLVGHVIHREGIREPFVVSRTNNPVEHRFGKTKQAIRRKVGTKKLARQLQAMRPERLLVYNLSDAEYVNLILDGSLANLRSQMAIHWDMARAIRKERLAPTTDRPIPTTKKQIRNPQLLDNVKRTIMQIVQIATPTGSVA
jgi:hypothetical protein